MDIVFARTTAIAGHVTINEGSHWPADDPIVQAFPNLFTANPRAGLSYSRRPADEDEPEQRIEQVPIEQATKAPGEKRTTRRAQ